MKNNIYLFISAALVLNGLSACISEEPLAEGKGRVTISTRLSSDVSVVSRAQSEEDLAESCTVWISNDKGVVREYHGLNAIPADGFTLYSGHYKAEGWAGSKAWASWDERWFEGSTEFDVVKGEVCAVNLNCVIQNTIVSVEYGDEVRELLTDYSVTASHVYGELTFEGDDERKGYFLISDDNRSITFTVNGTTVAGEAFTHTETIDNAKPTTEYVLTVHSTADNSELGGGYLVIDVDEREVVIKDEITIVAAPEISAYNYEFDLDQPVMGQAGQIGRKSIVVKGACALRSVIMESETFESVLHLGGEDLDFLNMTDGFKQELEQKGIEFNYEYDETLDLSTLKINLESSFTDQLTDGEYTFSITATDALDKTTEKTLTLIISSDPAIASEAVPGEVYTDRATLRATKVKDATSYGFNYRSVTSRSDEWRFIEGQVVGNEIVAQLSGLTPGTTYEYTAVADGEPSSIVMTLTTEEASQLPNAGFEYAIKVQDNDIAKNKQVTVFTDSEANWFWDCGNWGSATMNKEVTEHSTEKVHSGEYSVALKSQFVGVAGIGKFAAGNIFVGKYLKTDGTDGVLGWGRKFNSRPTKLRGWVHYTPVAVTSDNSKYEALKKGDMDQGIIYIALLDDSKHDSEYSDYPVVVRTKTLELFDKNGSNVIAYGEMVLTGATSGDNMVQFEINLDYKRTDVKPSYIMVTASASIGGDYFVGGNGSTMYLDDLELVY